MSMPHRVSVVVLAGLVLVAGAASATKPKPKPNDGLPAKWYGFTTFKLFGQDQYKTFADVTLTLKKRAPYTKVAPFTVGSAGTFYSYAPSGPITVWGHCSSPVEARLAADDGVLLVAVPKGAPKRARYYGKDTFRLLRKLPGTCPDGSRAEPRILTWGFVTYEQQPMPVGRRMTTSAAEIRGTYIDPSSGNNNRYEWCFTRAEKSSACLDLEP